MPFLINNRILKKSWRNPSLDLPTGEIREIVMTPRRVRGSEIFFVETRLAGNGVTHEIYRGVCQAIRENNPQGRHSILRFAFLKGWTVQGSTFKG